MRIQYDLKCKRASFNPSSLYKEITALFYSMINIWEIIEKIEKRIVKLSYFCKGELLMKLY
jgi:hypothetical protein